jgi:hypothetical protein
MGGKVLRASALYPRDNLKRMDILATTRMVSVLWYNRPLQKPIDRGSGNAERVTDLHVADGSEGSSPAVGDFSCGRRSIQGWNCKPLK